MMAFLPQVQDGDWRRHGVLLSHHRLRGKHGRDLGARVRAQLLVGSEGAIPTDAQANDFVGRSLWDVLEPEVVDV